jgi:hypothetical protein
MAALATGASAAAGDGTRGGEGLMSAGSTEALGAMSGSPNPRGVGRPIAPSRATCVKHKQPGAWLWCECTTMKCTHLGLKRLATASTPKMVALAVQVSPSCTKARGCSYMTVLSPVACRHPQMPTTRDVEHYHA